MKKPENGKPILSWSVPMAGDFGEDWQCNCLTTVAALGFEDIPPRAFIKAYNLVEKESWVAINIKDEFLGKKDQTGCSWLIKQMIFDFRQLYYLERYRHRISIDGKALYYYALIGRKIEDYPENLLFTQRVSEN